MCVCVCVCVGIHTHRVVGSGAAGVALAAPLLSADKTFDDDKGI